MERNTITYSSANPAVEDFLKNTTYDPLRPDVSHVGEYVLREADYDKSKPVGTTVHLPAGLLTVRDGGSGIEYRLQIADGDFTFRNLTPNVQSEYTVTRDGTEVAAGHLMPEGALRMIDCGDSASNVRDLGGWKCDGGTVRYGKLFRGSEITEDARDVLVGQCGVAAELDLRGADEVTWDHSVLGQDIDFCFPPEHQFYSVSRPDIWRLLLRFIFDCARDEKPLYFHCAGGADRTGTCACIIEALLGVSRSDIDLDYELTSFKTSDAMRLRNTRDAWGALMFELYEELPSAPSLRDRVALWVTGLGFTEDEIDSFRRYMIDGEPEHIDLSHLRNIKIREYPAASPAVADFLSEVRYDPEDRETSLITMYFNRDDGCDRSKPLGITVPIDGGRLTVHDRYTHIFYSIDTSGSEAEIKNLTPGYVSEYTVTDGSEITDFGLLRPTGKIRLIDCGNGASNVRDLGGWSCDGGMIRYGRLFRGGLISDPTKARDVLVEQCGVRAELNLRGAEESPDTDSPLGDDIRCCRPERCQWYKLDDGDVWREIFRFIFDAARDRLPLYFHCAAGGDRTGTCAYIIEALLGVSQSDIDLDYELSDFADTECGRLRSNRGEWTYGWLCDSADAISEASVLRDRIALWLKSLGFTADDINTFRHYMIDGSPEDITFD